MSYQWHIRYSKDEVVLWIVGGIIDATDVMEDYEYDSDECLDTRGLRSAHPTVINPFSSAVGLGAETNPGIPAGPWFDLLKFVVSVVSGFHDRSSPYLISSTLTVSRLMPSSQNAQNMLYHFFSALFKGSYSCTSRVDGAEVFFELCRIRSCAQLIQADSSLHKLHPSSSRLETYLEGKTCV